MSQRGRGRVQASPAKHYCFTYNNPTLDSDDIINVLKQDVTYLVFQKESGENATVHYQGYFELKTPKRITALRRILACHYEKRNGSVQQAIDYCKKDDTRVAGPWEVGTPSHVSTERGKRNDLIPLYDAARAGKTLDEIADLNPASYMRNYRAIQHIRQMKALENPGVRETLNVLVYFGAPGTGKTYKAYTDYPDLYAIPCGKDIWFDNYAGEKTMLYDDFSGQVRLVDLLRYLDKYPVQVPVKGAFVFLHCTTIIITTNVHPSRWYDYTKRQSSEKALARRFSDLFWFRSKNERPQKFTWDPYTPDEEDEYLEMIKYDLIQRPTLQRQDATVTSTNADEEAESTEEEQSVSTDSSLICNELLITYCRTCALEVTPALWCTCEKCTCVSCVNK